MPAPLYILAGRRTPFVRVGSTLSRYSATELGQSAAGALLAETGVNPAALDEVIFGCVSPSPSEGNVARLLALRAGIPESVPAVTVQRGCASSLEALTTAAERVAAGRGSLYLVGGTESMSATLAPHASSRRGGAPASGPAALTDPLTGESMGQTAETLAREEGITRDAQEMFALRSHARAVAATAWRQEEIAPVYPFHQGAGLVQEDSGPRPGATREALQALPPAFDPYGTITAGTASPLTDGAVALLVGTEERAHALSLPPLGRLVDYAYTGCDPRRMGLGPVSAMAALAARTGRKPEEAAVIEINEAFAAQVLAVCRQLREQGLAVPEARLNPHGGALALGHPVGATGARLVLSALRALATQGGRHALVSLCVGGGQGAALWLEAA